MKGILMVKEIKDREWQNLLPYLVILLSSMMVIFQWSNGHDWGDDFAGYILQAISIAKGEVSKFVLQNAFTINDSSYAVGPITYPWGFPILLSPIYMLFGLNFTAFKAMCLVFFMFFLLTLVLGFKEFLDKKEIAIFVAFFGINVEFIKFSDFVLSDLPFLFFSTIAVLQMSGASKLNTKKQALIIFLGLGISISCAVMIRTNGFLLLITYFYILLIYFITERYSKLRPYFYSPFEKLRGFSNFFKLICLMIPIFTTLLTISLVAQILPDKQVSHLDFLSRVSIYSIIDNAFYYALLPGSFFSPKHNLGVIIFLLTIPFVFIGIKDKWKNTTIFIVYTILTITMYLVWPARQGLRFLYPIMPFYIFYFLIGIRQVPNITNHMKSSLIISTLIIFILLIPQSAISITHKAYRDLRGPYTSPAQEMFKFITENTAKEDVIIFHKPRAMRLFTERNSLVYSKPEDFVYRKIYVHSKEFQQSLTSDQLEQLSYLYPLIQIYDNDEFIVYQFKGS